MKEKKNHRKNYIISFILCLCRLNMRARVQIMISRHTDTLDTLRFLSISRVVIVVVFFFFVFVAFLLPLYVLSVGVFHPFLHYVCLIATAVATFNCDINFFLFVLFLRNFFFFGFTLSLSCSLNRSMRFSVYLLFFFQLLLQFVVRTRSHSPFIYVYVFLSYLQTH